MGSISSFINLLFSSKYTVAFTGSGVSAESGIPTFRGKKGIWKRINPDTVATREGFLKNPVFVWKWYLERFKTLEGAKVNYAHIALAKLEKKGLLKAVITQNIDGLHQKAGSKKVIELHGTVKKVKCLKCGKKFSSSIASNTLPPTCPKCGGLLRPDVVWFGEPLPEKTLNEAFQEVSKTDLLIVIGTSGTVMPAAMIPYLAKQKGAKIVEVNTEETPITAIADLFFKEPCSILFRKLMEEAKI